MKSNPYLSIIIVSRNDDYQVGAFKRMQVSISNLIDQAKRCKLRAELILVEWNPPSGRPLLNDALSWPNDLGPLTVRIIIVPPPIHKTYKCSDYINIMAAPALNVGIRRAGGEFISTMNSDILFSDELVQFLASEKLKKAYFYKAPRYDVHRDVLKCVSLKEQLAFCGKNILRICQPELDKLPLELPALHSLPGDFVVFAKEYWHLLHGYAEINNISFAADLLLCYMAHLAGLKEKILEDPLRVYHIDHYSKWRENQVIPPQVKVYHIDHDSKERASQQSSKKNEPFKLRIFYFIKNKFYNRLGEASKRRTLMRRVYRFKKKASCFVRDLFYNQCGPFLQRINKTGAWDFKIRYLFLQYQKVLIDMLKGKRSYIYNDESWGLPSENFTEYIISSGHKISKIN